MGDIEKLSGFTDERLFQMVSEGIPLIVQNAESLDENANRLAQAKEFRASEIIRGFAEEEAAKVLILLDVVRCPADSDRKLETLRFFDRHLAKRLYALTCSFPRISSYQELRSFIENECQRHYLDGPNSVDWVFPNSIIAERERTMYVDYVWDMTENAGDYWSSPEIPGHNSGPYRPPESVRLCRALCDAGANSADGLSVIADTWRGFAPENDTCRSELRDLIDEMLERLADGGHIAADGTARSLIRSCWSFPLWPLDLQYSLGTKKSLNKLLEERKLTIEWIEKTEAKRDPPPSIDRAKVEAMSDAYAVWWREAEEVDAKKYQESNGGFRFLPAAELGERFDLPSYGRMRVMFEALGENERMALLALAWFTRDVVANWPRAFEQAKTRFTTIDTDYQIGLGGDWLAGLNRWEEAPEKFSPGRRFRPQRAKR